MLDYHKPALLHEVIEGLDLKFDGTYVDVTFGGGGHAREILKRLSDKGKLFAFDQDPDAVANLWEDDRLVFVPHNFTFLKNFLRAHQAVPVDGILADLGVSFHQFDQAERGFSFRFSGPLDMRMDQKRELTAEEVVNDYEQTELENIFRKYGELKNAKKIAALLLESRKEERITSIEKLKEVVSVLVPAKVEHKFLAQLFQAIRIEVNEELLAVEKLLEQALEVLKEGGLLAVITYHSLEDRLVKNFFRSGNFEGKVEKDFYGNVKRPFEPVNRKPIVPKAEEVQDNNRARSAKLRVARKLA
ncbi:MAG: 16S rRNA (cytosine(1402)-N(4))-methyltransferase RsmH [Vicingaceae bacterium]